MKIHQPEHPSREKTETDQEESIRGKRERERWNEKNKKRLLAEANKN